MASATTCCRVLLCGALAAKSLALPSASTVDATQIRNSLFLTEPLRTPAKPAVNVIMREAHSAGAASFLGTAASEPFFPPGSDDLLPAVAAKVKQLDLGAGAEGASVEKMVAAARKELAASLEKEGLREELHAAVASAAELAVKRYVYLGGCPRDFSASCPIGWSAGSGGACEPPADYSGPCGSMSFSSLGQSQLEDAVLKCSVDFPCAAPCDHGFSACPEGWSEEKGLCTAGASYDGLCSPVADFREASDESKALWSARCGASFSCP